MQNLVLVNPRKCFIYIQPLLSLGINFLMLAGIFMSLSIYDSRVHTGPHFKNSGGRKVEAFYASDGV